MRNQPRSPATVNRYLASLRHVFTIAVNEWGWLEQSPLQQVNNLKESPGRTRVLSDSERESLLHACQQSSNRDLYLAVVLALSTAARKMEIMQLRRDDVDLKHRKLIFRHTKNGECRAVPLQGHAYQLLAQKLQHITTNLVFPSRMNSQQPLSFRAAWEYALRVAEVTDFRWHDLRHSAASYLAMNGATLIELSQILGHKSLSMVQRYAHLSENHTDGIIALMNQRLFRTATVGHSRGANAAIRKPPCATVSKKQH